MFPREMVAELRRLCAFALIAALVALVTGEVSTAALSVVVAHLCHLLSRAPRAYLR